MKVKRMFFFDFFVFFFISLNLINVKFYFFPVSSFIWTAPFFFIGSIILYFHSDVNVSRFSKFYKSIVFFACFILVYSFISVIFNTVISRDVELKVMMAVFAISFGMIFFIFFVRVYFRHNKERILLFIGMVGFLNSIFIIGMFFSMDFKVFWSGMVISSIENLGADVDLVEDFMSLRMVGINGFSAYATAFQQSVFLVFYFLYIKLTSKKPSYFDYFVILSIVFSAVIAARTFFVLLPFLLFVYVAFFGFVNVGKLMSSIAIFLLISLMYISSLDGHLFNFFLEWVSQPFLKGAETGSLDANLRMFSSEKLKHISLIGDFILRDGRGYYLGVDVGYLRLLYSFGVFGSLFFLMVILWPVIHRIKRISNYMIAYTTIALMLLVVMFKGLILLDWYPVIFLLYILYVSDGDSKINHAMIGELKVSK